MATDKLQAPYVHCIDHVGISTANFQGTIGFLNNLLGLEHRFADDINFGCDPALLCAPGNNSGVALCPGTSRGLNHIAFRVSERGFQHTQKCLQQQGIAFKIRDKKLMQMLLFREPINGYEIQIVHWPPSKSSHALRQVSRSALRRVSTKSFFGGMLTGVILTAVTGMIVAKYLDLR
eukprot:TRINITY_DN7046_c0_g1_i3.p1 TRINITY_DN7046_c0_g1~~TRINITY_DN7046_c0_g1_i3.p1  ORF type:complete len:177 (+),score=32.72 TRINITY_DN7046_c0_g1_i3:213-743(+)